jgi:hypothetical protein
VAHNSRRSRVPEEDSPPVLTKDLIAEAMAKAVALRHRVASDPAEVDALALRPHDAIGYTEGWRRNTRWYRAKRYGATEPDPWYWIGWVTHETPAGCVERCEKPCREHTWAVWVNVDDGRVWLRLERYGRDADDPYP